MRSICQSHFLLVFQSSSSPIHIHQAPNNPRILFPPSPTKECMQVEMMQRRAKSWDDGRGILTRMDRMDVMHIGMATKEVALRWARAWGWQRLKLCPWRGWSSIGQCLSRLLNLVLLKPLIQWEKWGEGREDKGTILTVETTDVRNRSRRREWQMTRKKIGAIDEPLRMRA